jgi:hypothetical protein
VQKVPVPRVESGNIVTEEDYDSPLLRYNLFKHAETSGIGRQNYHVIGWDEIKQTPLKSVNGHIGWLEEGKFTELITDTFYYNPGNILWGLQKTSLAYLKANDIIAGTNVMKEVMDAYDENSDGVLDYDEMGRDAFWHTYLRLAAYYYSLRGTRKFGVLEGTFLLSSMWKYAEREWNPEGHDFMKNFQTVTWIAMAHGLSQIKDEKEDPHHEGISWGDGNWPSLKLVKFRSTANRIFGPNYPSKISLNSMYGLAFQYADKTQNNGAYTGSPDLKSDPESIEKYLEAVEKGAEPIKFTLYVPKGHGKLGERKIVNIAETEDPRKIYTADFKEGGEIW